MCTDHFHFCLMHDGTLIFYVSFLFVDVAVERGFNSFAEHLNMLLDEAYVDEESCDPDEEKKEDDNDNISLHDDFEETALAEKEWDEREAETTVESKEARQGRVRSGSLKDQARRLCAQVSPLNFLPYHVLTL